MICMLIQPQQNPQGGQTDCSTHVRRCKEPGRVQAYSKAVVTEMGWCRHRTGMDHWKSLQTDTCDVCAPLTENREGTAEQQGRLPGSAYMDVRTSTPGVRDGDMLAVSCRGGGESLGVSCVGHSPLPASASHMQNRRMELDSRGAFPLSSSGLFSPGLNVVAVCQHKARAKTGCTTANLLMPPPFVFLKVSPKRSTEDHPESNSVSE